MLSKSNNACKTITSNLIGVLAEDVLFIGREWSEAFLLTFADVKVAFFKLT